MRDITYYNEIEQALEKSWQAKNGDWSSPREVAGFTDESVTLPTMRELVRRGWASERLKTPGVFKPRRGAAGPGGAALQGTLYRSPRGQEPAKPEQLGRKGPRLGATMLVGGMGGGAPAGAAAAPRTGGITFM